MKNKTDKEPQVEMVETNEEYNQNLKKRLGDEYNMTLINYEELIDIAPEFAIWLKELVRYGNVDSQILIFLDTQDLKGINRFICKLFTNEHIYSITGYKPIENNVGYLGCTASTRKYRVGEFWNRGNDLPDGAYSKETFDAIVKAIVAYELKPLELWRK